jgi:DNA-directed RNA polymerase III subunit RPC1
LKFYADFSAQASGGRDRGLLPFEVMELVNREFGSARFQNECTPAYLDTIRTFISKNIVYKMAEERTRRGMFDALERGDEWDDKMDFSLGALGLC